MPPLDLAELNRRFGVPGQVRFAAGQGGLTRMEVDSPLCQAHVYLHGAHVTHFQHPGQPPLLFLSQASAFADGKPIRGGVPVIFPWFGQRPNPSGDPAQSPMHGLVRLVAWDVEAVAPDPRGGVAATLVTRDSPRTRAVWPHRFELRHILHLGDRLDMTLEVRNLDTQAFTFEEALHTYIRVGDVRRASVTGLAGATYESRVEGRTAVQDDQPIRFREETDRLYTGTTAPCLLDDPALGRRVTVDKAGSRSTVVWNPWIRKAAAMPDFGDQEWPDMLCLETANARQDAVSLPTGQVHVMRASLASTMTARA